APGLETFREPLLRPDERHLVHERVRNRGCRVALVPPEVEVLDLPRLGLVAVAGEEVVVEVLAPGAHPPDVQRVVGLEKLASHPSPTCGPDVPSPSRKRPPERRSSVAAVIAVFAGVRPGICMIAEPSFIRSVVAPSQESTVTQSVPQASAAHAESYPRRSASCAMAIGSSGLVPRGADTTYHAG